MDLAPLFMFRRTNDVIMVLGQFEAFASSKGIDAGQYIFATNTSSLKISDIASQAAHPAQVCVWAGGSVIAWPQANDVIVPFSLYHTGRWDALFRPQW